MPDTEESFRTKVDEIFTELAGEDRAKWLGAGVPSRVMDLIADAVSTYYEENVPADIGFHVGDWQADAAFLVALHLFPERFTLGEIDDGVTALLQHVPGHVVAAAKLAGHPVTDFDDDHEA